MYLPYLRGKQFELEALLEVPMAVYRNTLPIIEPVNDANRLKLYLKLANRNVPFILISNPYHPSANRLSPPEVQDIINTQMPNHQGIIYGFIVDQRFSVADLNLFLNTYNANRKALIFRFNPLAADLIAIQNSVQAHPVDFMIFDDRKTNLATRAIFAGHPNRILITDGFQRQDKNADYPAISAFESNYANYVANGWQGIGDFLSVGDFYQEGGGQVYVITLHITRQDGANIVANHFSSTIHSATKGLPAVKFTQANQLLVTSPHITPLASTGLDLYRNWDATGHNPQLGAAKKASIMHHIELMSGII